MIYFTTASHVKAEVRKRNLGSARLVFQPVCSGKRQAGFRLPISAFSIAACPSLEGYPVFKGKADLIFLMDYPIHLVSLH